MGMQMPMQLPMQLPFQQAGAQGFSGNAYGQGVQNPPFQNGVPADMGNNGFGGQQPQAQAQAQAQAHAQQVLKQDKRKGVRRTDSNGMSRNSSATSLITTFSVDGPSDQFGVPVGMDFDELGMGLVAMPMLGGRSESSISRSSGSAVFGAGIANGSGARGGGASNGGDGAGGAESDALETNSLDGGNGQTPLFMSSLMQSPSLESIDGMDFWQDAPSPMLFDVGGDYGALPSSSNLFVDSPWQSRGVSPTPGSGPKSKRKRPKVEPESLAASFDAESVAKKDKGKGKGKGANKRRQGGGGAAAIAKDEPGGTSGKGRKRKKKS